jgi:hypothetical protein
LSTTAPISAAAAEMGAVVLNVGRGGDREEDCVSNGANPGSGTTWGRVNEWSE